MQCEYRDNASGRVTAAESIADAWSRDARDVSYREMDSDWRPLTDWQPYRAATAGLYAPPAPTDAELDAYVPPDPMLEIDRDTMRLLGELADLAGEDEAKAVTTAVAAYHAAVFGSRTRRARRRRLPGIPATHPKPRRPQPCASQ